MKENWIKPHKKKLKKNKNKFIKKREKNDCVWLLIDGSNILEYQRINGKKIAKSSSLKNFLKYLQELKDFFPKLRSLIYVDGTLRNKIDDRNWLLNIINSNLIVECPMNVKADEMILNLFIQNPTKVKILSNDQFREYPIPAPLKNLKWRFSFSYKNHKITIPKLKAYLKSIHVSNIQKPIILVNKSWYLEDIF